MPSAQFQSRAAILPIPNSGIDEPIASLSTEEPRATPRTGDPKATQQVFIDGKFNLENLPPGVMPLPRIDGYEILGILGRGGMGVVYKARETKLQRLVALKMILAGAHASPRDLLRFQTEARAVAKLQHPNIVQIYDINEQDGQHFFSLELVDGDNLAAKLAAGPLLPRESVKLVETLARAMYYAHEHNIVHRDLKPGNILLTAQGTPKITDFGVAKQLDSEQGQTKSGAIVGTPSYMAPEQARGQTKTLGPAADIFSLGAILYEMLTGRPPFQGETPIDTMFKVAHEDPEAPSRLQPTLPRDLEVICLKCLEKDPNRRYLTAQALANDLARFLADEPILARPLSVWERGRRWAKRHKARTAVAAAILIAVVGIAAGMLRSQSIDRHRVEEKQYFTWNSANELERTVESKSWEATPGDLQKIRSSLASDSELAAIREGVEEKLGTIEARFQARKFHRDFLARYDDSMFQFAMALGQEKKLESLQHHAWNALELVGIELGKADLRLHDYRLDPTESKAIEEGCYELLLTLATLGKGSHSLAILDLTKHLSIQTPSCHRLRARRLAELQKANEAQAETNLHDPRPMTAVDYFLAGNEFYTQGKIPEAGEEYAKALQLRPDYFWARYYLAYCDIRTGEPARARDNLTACAGQKPNVIWIYLMRGYAEGQLKNYEAAEKDFQTALGLKPAEDQLYVLYNNRGVIRLDQENRLGDGVQDLQKAAGLSPRKYNAYASLADACARRKNWGEAVEHIDRAIACADDVAVQGILYRYRARYHSELKDAPAALADLDKEIALEAEGGVPSAKPYVLRGRMLQKNQRFEESLASFEAARKVQPGSAEALRGRAEMLFEMKNFPQAILAFNDVIEKAAPTSQDYKLRGLCKSNQGDHQGAAEDYSRALDLETKAVGSEKRTSNMAWLHTHRGNAYLAFQADRPAMTDFEEVLRWDPENAEALCGRGLARVRLGPIDPGVRDVKHALRIGPATSRLSYSCARIYAQAAAKLSSNDRKDRTTLAKIGDFENRALDFIGQALTLLPPSERARFWEHTVAKDGCMAVIRRTSSFSQLEEKYAPQTKDIKRAGSVAGSAVMAR